MLVGHHDCTDNPVDRASQEKQIAVVGALGCGGGVDGKRIGWAGSPSLIGVKGRS